MKETETLHLASLQHMEIVSMARETTTDTQQTAPTLMGSDEPLKRIVNQMVDTTNRFEVATRNPQDSGLTKERARLDKQRDNSVRRWGRKLAFYEYSSDEAELLAYETLLPLWEKHKDIPGLNQKKQTGATDNFANDMAKTPFAEAIEVLKMETESAEVKTTNEAFKNFEQDSRQQAAKEEMARAVDLRKELTEQYSFFYQYIWTMANAYPDNAEWDALLIRLNLIRKRYTELINRRRAAGKESEEGTEETTE